MKFSSQQLPSGKWGIYSGPTLLATISCQATCDTIMANLLSGRRDAPPNDTTSLYQAPNLTGIGKEKLVGSRSLPTSSSVPAGSQRHSAATKAFVKRANKPAAKRISAVERKAERKVHKGAVVRPTAS
ncbi:MAG: hypothetical protein AAFR18_00265 [Cyanobacteria bacterium J06627_32]